MSIFQYVTKLARFTHINWRMAEFTALNFTQIISPTGGSAPTAAGAQTGLLSGNATAGSSIFGDQLLSAANPTTTDIFTLLLGKGNTLPKQEKFTGLGKNLPAPKIDEAKLGEKKTDSSIDQLQAALTGLAVQQSAPVVPAPVAVPVEDAPLAEVVPAPVVVPADTISGGQGEDTVVGGTQYLTAQNNAQASAQMASDILADDKTAAVQSFWNDKADSKQFSQSSLLEQARNLLNNASIAKKFAQTNVQNVAQNDVPAPVVDQALQGKTVNAYRAAVALSQAEVGSTLDTNDTQAAANASAVLAQQAVDEANLPSNKTATTDASVMAAAVKDDAAQTVSDALARLKDLSAAAPLPQTDDKKVVVADAASLHVATTQPVPVAEPEAKKSTLKAETASVPASAQNNTVTPQAVVQANQQNNSQQFGQKKQNGNVEAVKATEEKVEVNSTQLIHAPKAEQTKVPAQDFANQLSKTLLSPTEQVAMKIAQLPSGKQNITVHLDPADLGKVDVKVEWNKDGRAHISISAENKDTLEMLKSDMGSLQRSLSDSGIKADASNLQFDLKGQENFAGQFAQQNQQKNDGNNNAQHSSDIELKQAVEKASIAARYINLNNLVDLHV